MFEYLSKDDEGEDLLDESREIPLDVMVGNLEKRIIKHAYDKYGSIRKAAKAIGISQSQFIRKKTNISFKLNVNRFTRN